MNSRVETPLGNPVVLWVMWVVGSPKFRVSVFAVSHFDLGKLSTKVQDCSESSNFKSKR